MLRSAPLLLLLLLAVPAQASEPRRVALPVGHQTTLAMPGPVSRVKVDDPSLVDIERKGRRVTLVGRKKGATEVTVYTASGEHRLNVYVAADKYGLPY